MVLPAIGPICVSTSLWAVPFTILRREYGSRQNGVYTPGQLTSVPAVGNFKVPRGDQLFEIPEGERKGEWLRVSTLTELRTAEEPNKHEADVILYYGVYYKVIACRRSRSAAYYLATCSRLSDVEFLSIILASGTASAHLTAAGTATGTWGISASASATLTASATSTRVLFGTGSASAQASASGAATVGVTIPVPWDLLTFDTLDGAAYGSQDGTQNPSAARTGVVTFVNTATTTTSPVGPAVTFGASSYGFSFNGFEPIYNHSFTWWQLTRVPVSNGSPVVRSLRNDDTVSPPADANLGSYTFLDNTTFGFALRTLVGNETYQQFALGVSIRDDQWHDYAVTVDRVANLVTLYFDGASIGSFSVAAQTGTVGKVGTKRIFALSAIDNAGGNTFSLQTPASWDDVARWQSPTVALGSLSAAQILALHNARVAGTSVRTLIGF